MTCGIPTQSPVKASNDLSKKKMPLMPYLSGSIKLMALI
jgi:hypothetical protein